MNLFLAENYLKLYGDKELLIDYERKGILNAMNTRAKETITFAAVYVIKSQFQEAKYEYVETMALDECIRVAELLLMDIPLFKDENIHKILKVARKWKDRRDNFKKELESLRNNDLSNTKTV